MSADPEKSQSVEVEAKYQQHAEEVKNSAEGQQGQRLELKVNDSEDGTNAISDGAQKRAEASHHQLSPKLAQEGFAENAVQAEDKKHEAVIEVPIQSKESIPDRTIPTDAQQEKASQPEKSVEPQVLNANLQRSNQKSPKDESAQKFSQLSSGRFGSSNLSGS